MNTTGIAYIPPQSPKIDFDANPVLRSNTLCVAPGQTVLVDSQVLKATQPGSRNENLLMFRISDLQHGYFSWVSAPAAQINSFYQYNVSYHQVQFTHDHSAQLPSYRVTVTDGRIETNPVSATVIFKAPLAVGQFPPILPLKSLNGQIGFKLKGEVSLLVVWVSGAGDVNGDGYADLLIGAGNHATYAGRSYLVFGGPTVGSEGTILLSNLNGANGFKLDGEGVGDYSGSSVSGISDINGDGYDDLSVGAYGYSAAIHIGRSYVIFGAANIGVGRHAFVIEFKWREWLQTQR